MGISPEKNLTINLHTVKAFRLAIVSFFFLFTLVLGISLFFPSHVRISRALNMTAGREDFIAQVGDPANWKSWYPGIENAPLYYENGQAKGVVMDTASKVMLIITGQGPDEVTAEFRSRMKPVVNGWKLISHPGTDSVTVQWYMDFRLRWYPWEKFASMLFDRSYGPKMEKGLDNLRNILGKGLPSP